MTGQGRTFLLQDPNTFSCPVKLIPISFRTDLMLPRVNIYVGVLDEPVGIHTFDHFSINGKTCQTFENSSICFCGAS